MQGDGFALRDTFVRRSLFCCGGDGQSGIFAFSALGKVVSLRKQQNMFFQEHEKVVNGCTTVREELNESINYVDPVFYFFILCLFQLFLQMIKGIARFLMVLFCFIKDFPQLRHPIRFVACLFGHWVRWNQSFRY